MRQKNLNGMGIGSLVLGILSCVCIMETINTALIGTILGVIGLVLGLISCKKNQSGIARAGWITSLIGLIICGLFIIVLFTGNSGIVASSSYNKKNVKSIIESEEETKEEIINKIEEDFKSAYKEYDIDRKLFDDKGREFNSYFEDELNQTLKNKKYELFGDQYSGGWSIYVSGYWFEIDLKGKVTEK